MSKLVLAICGKRNGQGWDACRFAYMGEIEYGERPRDAQYVLKLIERLSVESDDLPQTSWKQGPVPEDGIQRFFDIYIDVQNHGKNNATYKMDYFKYPKCPSAAIDDGMQIFHAIKKNGLRPAMKTIEASNKVKVEKRREAIRNFEEEQERMDSLPRFEAGRNYSYDKVDSLGYKTTGIVRVNTISDDNKTANIDIIGIRNGVNASIMFSNTTGESMYMKSVMSFVSAANKINKGTIA